MGVRWERYMYMCTLRKTWLVYVQEVRVSQSYTFVSSNPLPSFW